MRFASLVPAASSAALALSFAGAAAADSPSLDLRGWHASADPEAGTSLEPASAPATGEWNVGLRMHWAYRPIELVSSEGDEVVPIEHQVTADLVAGVGLWERVFLGLDLPYAVAQIGDEVVDPGMRSALRTSGAPLVAIGDLGLSGKLVLVPPDDAEFGGFGVAALQRFTLPTGDESGWLGEGAGTSESRLLVEWRSAPLSALVAGGIKFRFEKETFLCFGATTTAGSDCPARFGHELPLAVGAVVRPAGLGFDALENVDLLAEARATLPLSPVGPFQEGEPGGAFASLAARLHARDLSFFGGVEVALTDGIGNAPVRVSLGIDFAPRDHDQDDDRIEDDVDQCRELPEDRDGFDDEDGCPEVDDDQDLVPDGEDRCPREAGPGTVDGCPVAGAVAAPSGVEQADATAVPAAAAAPSAPAGPAAPVATAVLAAPAAVDPDGDTYPSATDKCPDAAETFDGRTDDDGCPEPAAPAGTKAPRPLAEVVSKEGVAVLSTAGILTFEASHAVTPASEPLLRAVASIAKRQPGSRLLVGARPAPARPEQAQKRAFAVAQELRGFVGRDDAVKVVDWDQVKNAPLAEIYGVGLVLVPATAPR